MNKTIEFEQLPLKEKIIRTTSTKLIKHFRGLENAGMLRKEEAANLIGCVKKLNSVASGEIR